MFHKTYPSGQLNEAQFVKLYEEFFPDGEPSEFATIVFNVFDQNKNGTIDFEEFVRALSVISRGSLNEKLRCTPRSVPTGLVHLTAFFFQGRSTYTISTGTAQSHITRCFDSSDRFTGCRD